MIQLKIEPTNSHQVAEMPADYTGITFTVSRNQPYTVWDDGQIVYYAFDEGRARWALRTTTKQAAG